MLDRFNDTYGIDEFLFRSSQSYEETLGVKRFFNEEEVKKVSKVGPERLRMDKLLDHISSIFGPLYDFENQYIPYIPQKPVQLIQFRTTQNPDICESIHKVQGMKTKAKHLPQCNLPYKNVNVTSFFKSERVEKEEFIFKYSNTAKKSGLQISDICSTELEEGICPDYIMSEVNGGVVSIQSQFTDAP